jgi:hypothetical protein
MKSRQGSAALIVLIVVVVLLLVAGAYYLGTRNMTPIAQNAGLGQPAAATTSDQYAGWQTYTNSAAGFQIKYPSVFTDPPTETTQGSYLSATFSANTSSTIDNTVGGETLVIFVDPSTASETLESDIQNYEKENVPGGVNDCLTQDQIVTTTIQGEEAARIDCSKASSVFGTGTIGSSEQFMVFHNNMQFIIGLSGDPSGSDTFTKIIESLVFTK